MRIGEVLVQQGILTQEQVDRAVEEQRSLVEPFGVICERLYGVHPKVVEGAWAAQYANLVDRIDPRLDQVDPAAESMITRRQAWQFRTAPLRYDGEHLVMVTCVKYLPRALRFATSHIAAQVFFVLVEIDQLADHLMNRYPMLGMDDEIVKRGFTVA